MACALGRPVGKFQVDGNGLARYSHKIDLPKGISKESTPDLSLEYAQGSPNSTLGTGWSVCGLSSIQLAAASLPFDSPNAGTDYDRTLPRLFLDGLELLCIQGTYNLPNAAYKPEVDTNHRTVTPLAQGFQLTDSLGTVSEYGTTPDSIIVQKDKIAQQWRIKTQIDQLGNAITYNYLTPSAPASESDSVDSGVSYIENIIYSSNTKTGFQGTRRITFEYQNRNDPVVHTAYGQEVTYASRLSKISVFIDTVKSVLLRFYTLDYSYSTSSGGSNLLSITEAAGDGTVLVPTVFDYTQTTQNPDNLFSNRNLGAQSLKQSSNTLTILPLDISGRGLGDVALIRYNPSAGSMTVKTYPADPSPREAGETPTIAWNAPGSEALLPSPRDPDNPMPILLSGDLNGDGRQDLIIPFQTSGGYLSFSLSLSIGTGFSDYQEKPTAFYWTPESKFLTIDLNGNGCTDVVQIFNEHGKLAFRVFAAINNGGQSTLMDAQITNTDYDFSDTIDWVQVVSSRDGAKSLVRIWPESDNMGNQIVKASSFALQGRASGNLVNVADTILGFFSPDEVSAITVLPYDVNGDGFQDIVLSLIQTMDRITVVDISMTFTTFLNNGMGSFIQEGRAQSYTYTLSSSEAPLSSGKVYVSDLFGSNYPSLVYVYTEQSSGNYQALVCGGSSSGLVGKPSRYLMANAEDLSGGNIYYSPFDLNGTGLGDWIFFSVDASIITLFSVYNQGLSPVDLLSSIIDPLGLVTSITYEPLSNPLVYDSGVQWDNYLPKAGLPNYPLIGTGTYVVSKINYSNNVQINSLPFNNNIEKKYGEALLSLQGYAWQGFSQISSYDSSTDSTTVDHYYQEWPLVGLQSQTDTIQGNVSGTLLQSSKTIYKFPSQQKGLAKIFLVNKTSEVRSMMENGSVAQTYGFAYEYDVDGNTILESAVNSPPYSLYTRYSYTSIGLVQALPTAKKVSTKKENVNLGAFEEGDLRLTTFEYDQATAQIKSLGQWSSDVSDFAYTQLKFDAFGNEIYSRSPSGLEITTTFDTVFNQYPIKVTEIGLGVNHAKKTAFHPIFGVEVATLKANGALTCFKQDQFGRTISSMENAASTDDSPSIVSAQTYLQLDNIVADATFVSQLSETRLRPSKSQNYSSSSLSSGSNYIASATTSTFQDGVNGVTTTTELVDCTGRVQKQASQNGDLAAIWRVFEYNSQGSRTLQSYPVALPPTVNSSLVFDWTPDPSTCVKMAYDALQRPLTVTKPSRSGPMTTIVNKRTYSAGGAKVQNSIVATTPGSSDVVLSQTYLEYDNVNGEYKLVARTDELGATTRYSFDPLGQLMSITDAAGKVETRAYSTVGRITYTSDQYRGNVQKLYDLSGNLVQETNAMNESTVNTFDSKGRMTISTAHNGRHAVYEYDQSSGDSLSSVTVYTTQDDTNFECKYQLTCDNRGRVSKSSISISPSESFDLAFTYDWQDQCLTKTLPDGSVLTNNYNGSLAASTGLSAETWGLSADFTGYSPFNKPNQWNIEGTGSTALSFSGQAVFDSQGVKTSQSLSAGQALVENHYIINDLDQISRTHEFISGETTDYMYSAGRLVSSQTGTSPQKSYAYDLSGNLSTKGDANLTYTPEGVVGTAGGEQILQVEYDGVGRMKSRTVKGKTVTFSYDGFGKISSMTDSQTQSTSTIVSDFQGNTLVRTAPDGTREIRITKEYELLVTPDNSQKIRRKLFSPDGHLLGTVFTNKPAKSPRESITETHSAQVVFADSKGNVSHIFNADGTLSEHLRYDDFGELDPPPQNKGSGTYEDKHLDSLTGMFDFGARWYDPLIGRFTTPDDILDEDSLKGVDGINRYAFENNDPINHVDPTGHWSWSSILGAVLGVVAIGLSLAITFGTFGAGGIVMAAVAGALMSGGIASASYSYTHRDETDVGKFWAGWGATVAVGAITGAISGGGGAWLSSAGRIASMSSGASRLVTGMLRPFVRTLSATTERYLGIAASIGTRAVVSALMSAGTQIATNAVQKYIFGQKNVGLFDGIGKAFLTGFAIGAVSAGASEYWARIGKAQALSSYQTVNDTWKYSDRIENVFSEPGKWESFFRGA